MLGRRAPSLLGTAFVIFVGCHGRARGAPPAVALTASAADASASSEPAPTTAAPEVPSLEALAARVTRLAPGMHELARGATGRSIPLPKAERDTCVRVTFAASEPVYAALLQADGSLLADAPGTNDGVLGIQGPVCYRKDAAPVLELDGPEGGARYVVWAAP